MRQTAADCSSVRIPDIMENKELEPNYLVIPDPALQAAGRDQQLEKAVEVMLSKLPKK